MLEPKSLEFFKSEDSLKIYQESNLPSVVKRGFIYVDVSDFATSQKSRLVLIWHEPVHVTCVDLFRLLALRGREVLRQELCQFLLAVRVFESRPVFVSGGVFLLPLARDADRSVHEHLRI